MPPVYPPLPNKILLAITGSALFGRRRNFRQDALRCTGELALNILGCEHIPSFGPGLLVMNHYQRPGFQAYWFSLAISAVLPLDIHWMMTSAWTDDGSTGAAWRAIISSYFLPRLANVYGFTSMPPMPPRPCEVGTRSTAVRHFLRVAGKTRQLLAMAPEGQDSPDGRLMRPHPGVGRLLALLDGLGHPIYPVGVFEDEHSLVLSFGLPFRLALPADLGSGERDQLAAKRVMTAIARQLPSTLRGVYPEL